MEVLVREILKYKQTNKLCQDPLRNEREREKKGEKKVLIRWLILKLSGCIIASMQGSSGSTDVDLIYLVCDQI